MNGWLEELSSIVNTAAKIAHLWEVEPAFDGDAWVWIWRKYVDQNAKDIDIKKDVLEAKLDAFPQGTTGVQVSFRAQLDAFLEQVKLEISAHAWLERHRYASWAMTYWTQVFVISYFEAKPQEYLQPNVIGGLLEGAWRDARKQAPRLINKLIKERDELLNQLRKEKLLGG